MDWTLFANHGIKALNEIAGCINSSNHTKKKTTRAQRPVLSFISDAYRVTFTGSLEQSSDEGGVQGVVRLPGSMTAAGVTFCPMPRITFPGLS